MNPFRFPALYFLSFLFLTIQILSAQYGSGGPSGGGSSSSTGTTALSLAQTNITLAQGAKAIVNYSLALGSGTATSTVVGVINRAILVYQQGINVSAYPSTSNPPFAGTLSIAVGKNVPPGKYGAFISATGGDPSNIVPLYIFVSNQTTTTVLTTATTTQSTTLTTSLPSTSATTSLPATSVVTTISSGGSASSGSIWDAIVNFFKRLLGIPS